MSENRSTALGYIGILTPIIWGTTYFLTTQFLPPDRPLLVATLRALPTGLVLVLGTKLPSRDWWGRFLLLSVLYCSGFFPLLFIAAYRLPGGVASVINSLGPIAVVVLSVPWLGSRIRPIQIAAGLIGATGVAFLVLRASARLDLIGVLAMVSGVLMMSCATVLTKRWGHPPGMRATAFTGWTFLLGGLTLLPFTLILEGLPTQLTGRNLAGIAYLVIFSGITSYALWFWALKRLPAVSVMFLSLVNPVVAAGIGWIALGQALNGWQLFGVALVLVAVLLGQAPARRPVPALTSEGDAISRTGHR